MQSRGLHSAPPLRTQPRTMHPAKPQCEPGAMFGGSGSLGLLHRDDTVHGLLLQRLLAATGPVNCDLIDGAYRSQAEVHAIVVLRQIAGSSDALRGPAFAPGENFHARADAVAIAL